MSPAFLTVDEVAEIMRCEHRTVRRAINAGELQAAMIGGRWLIRLEAVQEWFDKRAASAPAPATGAAPRPALDSGRRQRRAASAVRRQSSDRAGSVTRLKAL